MRQTPAPCFPPQARPELHANVPQTDQMPHRWEVCAEGPAVLQGGRQDLAAQLVGHGKEAQTGCRSWRSKRSASDKPWARALSNSS